MVRISKVLGSLVRGVIRKGVALFRFPSARGGFSAIFVYRLAVDLHVLRDPPLFSFRVAEPPVSSGILFLEKF
jgi:hypothetical protein